MTADAKRLRAKFPKELIGLLPKTEKRPAMPYVGHAAVTDRLNDAAPGWTMDVRDQFDRGNVCWVLLRVTIDGVSRDEYGDGRDPKSAIGNALRRCAMRWGVALDLWSKEELDVDSGTKGAALPVSESTSSSERSGGAGTPDTSAHGEGVQPDLSDSSPRRGDPDVKVATGATEMILEDTTLDKIVDKYGVDKALAAARRMGFRVTSLGQLTEAEAQKMLDGEVA